MVNNLGLSETDQ